MPSSKNELKDRLARYSCSGTRLMQSAPSRGTDYETAVVLEERRKYLSRYDPKSAHYLPRIASRPITGVTRGFRRLVNIEQSGLIGTGYYIGDLELS